MELRSDDRYDNLTVEDALILHRKANFIDPQGTASPTWVCKFGPFTVSLPNFGWRRKAISHHDLHHILTGVPCTIRGECQMAAWEFSAGRYPDKRATLFCLPLVLLGALLLPRDLYKAYMHGRYSKSLYGSAISSDTIVKELRLGFLFRGELHPDQSDKLAFIILVLQSLTLVGAIVTLGIFILYSILF